MNALCQIEHTHEKFNICACVCIWGLKQKAADIMLTYQDNQMIAVVYGDHFDQGTHSDELFHIFFLFIYDLKTSFFQMDSPSL